MQIGKMAQTGVKRANSDITANAAKKPNITAVDNDIALYLQSRGYNKEKLLALANLKIFNEKTEDVVIFDPSQPDSKVESWLEALEKHGVEKKLSAADRIALMKKKLAGAAEIWYWHLNNYNFTWEEWKKLLICSFTKEGDLCTVLKELMAREKRKDEKYNEYFREKYALCIKSGFTGKNIIYFLIHGLPQEDRAKAQETTFSNAEDFYRRFLGVLDKPAQQKVGSVKSAPSVNTASKPAVALKKTAEIVQTPKKSPTTTTQNVITQTKAAVVTPSKTTTQTATTAQTSKTTQVTTPTPPIKQDVKNGTPERKVEEPKKQVQRDNDKTIKCFSCGKQGHRSNKCPQRNAKPQNNYRPSGQFKAPHNANHNQSNQRHNQYQNGNNNTSPYQSNRYFVPSVRGRYGGFL